MATITVDTSLLVDGQIADGTDVTTPIFDLKEAVENVINGVQSFDQIKLAAATTLIIASGAITITNSHHKIDTEGAAATDDLDTINGGSDGDILFLSTMNDARDVVVKHGTGNIITNSGSDFTLINSSKVLQLFCTGANWIAMDSAVSIDLHSPGPIGNVTPGSGEFTTLEAAGPNMLNGASTIADANFAASTSGGASVNIAEGVDPTTPASGDIWHDSTQKVIEAYLDGVKQSFKTVLFTNNNALSVPNDIAENTMFPTGVGTLSLPADFLKPGKTIHVVLMGIFTSSGTPTVTFRLKLGGTTIVSTAVAPGARTNFHWHLEFYLTCYTTGVSGAVRASGIVNALNAAVQFAVSAANVTVNTTVPQTLGLTQQNSVASHAHTVTNVVVEVLN